MNWLRLAVANIALTPVNAAVNILLMGLGTASIVLLILAGEQLSSTLSRDARGVDLVVGAQGSPVQLILSSVYHADLPPGNIRLSDAERWIEDPRVAIAAPLSLGDSYRGFRIVGSTSAYLTLVGATLSDGELWDRPMQAVLGAAAARASGLAIGDFFSGAHGFADGGHEHEAAPYEVVGILEPRGSVVDRLVLTSLESVWALHGVDGHTETDHAHEGEAEEHESSAEITALLIRYRNPLAATTLPREINAQGALQAAAPAMEIARLLQLVGFGLDGLRAFAWILVLTACVSVFAALYGSLRSRRGDLAMLRCLGATRWEVFLAILCEGMLLSGVGILVGFGLGHASMGAAGIWLEAARGIRLAEVYWVGAETRLLLSLMAISVLSAGIPALQAYRTDVASTLVEGGRAA